MGERRGRSGHRRFTIVTPSPLSPRFSGGFVVWEFLPEKRENGKRERERERERERGRGEGR
ncbi:hypothetical protein HanRHA438_Chr02g0062861 [Helianthus annuus]|nr:hypothetical protein HanRHA438_Chr02g0062861 [Helianthus annuus]